MSRPAESLQTRFDRYTVRKPKQCWLWIGGKDKDGYGKFQLPAIHSPDARAHTKRATHVAWFLMYGLWPVGMILHSCDNPACVRVAHLREGDHKQNRQDCLHRGRQGSVGQHNHDYMRGESHHLAKLTESSVRLIRKMLAAKTTRKEIAMTFKVSEAIVGDIKMGRAWGWLK